MKRIFKIKTDRQTDRQTDSYKCIFRRKDNFVLFEYKFL